MGIEGIKSMAAMSSYQSTTKVAETNTTSATQPETADISATSTQLAQETMAIDTKETSSSADGDANENSANPEAQKSKIKKAVEEINKKAKNSEAVFGIHEKTNRVTIKIMNKETKEIIKEFPPDKTLDMIARVWEMAGLMVDEKR